MRADSFDDIDPINNVLRRNDHLVFIVIVEVVRLSFESFEDRRTPEAAISGLTIFAHDDDLDGVFTRE
jgi:hypothetical protein